jgi:hypothetical protein
MNEPQAVILVHSTSHAILIEKLLIKNGLRCKLIPVPRQLSSDCGVCVRISKDDITLTNLILSETNVEIQGIYET